ncbi:MAG: hypothetical protein HOO96_38690 [Polyangiaceae bacterium]|nr:hypothetical protein [Polyangiaceae bacterium]
MAATVLEVRRLVLAQCPWVNGVELEGTGNGVILVHVDVAADAPADAAARIDTALDEVRPMCMDFAVSIGTRPVAPLAPPSGWLALASLVSDESGGGLTRSLTHLVPAVERIHHNADGRGGIEILASDFEGNAPPAFLERVRKAAEATVSADVRISIRPLPAGDPRGSLDNAGFYIPRRTRALVDFTDQEQEKYAVRLRRLLDGAEEHIPVVDAFQGNAIVCTTTMGGNAPVSCFLPLYDRLYLKMPPALRTEEDAEAYLHTHFGFSSRDFFVYCARGKIVPVFKFAMGHYPTAIATRFLDDLSLAMVTPRQLDFIVARYAWRNAAYVRALRDDRALSAAAHERLRALKARDSHSEADALMIEALGFALTAATSFEGMMWHRGHLFSAHFSPAALLVHMASVTFDAKDESMRSLDVQSSAHTAALSQAFNASAYDGLSMHQPIHQLVAQFFGDSASLSPRAGKTTKQLVEAFQLAYSEEIPADEYLDLFDRAETRRVRAIVNELLGAYGVPEKQEELRDAVRSLNDQVAKMARRDLLRAEVDVVGNLASAGKAAAGSTAIGNLLASALDLKIVKVVGQQAFDALVEDTKLGDAFDAIRGGINRTPAAAVRLFRIRSRLAELKAQKK